jgi:hypothetical protein
MLEQQREFFF